MDAQALFAWQQQRRIDGAPHQCPLRGFGPEGAYTLWCVSPTPAPPRMRFVNGRPVPVEEAVAPPFPPALAAIRARVVATFRCTGPGRLCAGLVFLEYAAAVLLHSYSLTDEDLEMLLCGGDEWHDDMVLHVCGGTEFAAAVQEVMTGAGPQHALPDEQFAALQAVLDSKPAPPRRWWERLRLWRKKST